MAEAQIPNSQPATPPQARTLPATDTPQRAKVTRDGSLRAPPADRAEIPEGTAEERIARLLNPKIAKDRGPDRRPAFDDDAGEGDVDTPPPQRAESPRVQEERENAELAEPDTNQQPEGDDDSEEVSLDDTPTPKQNADGEVEWEDTEYTAPNGKKYTVPKDLVEGAMRQQHFTKVTEEAAAERRYNVAYRQQMETDSAIQAELAPSIAQIQQLDQHIANLRLQKDQPGITVETYIELDRQLSRLTDTRGEFQGAVTKRSTELSAQKQAVVAALQGAAENLLSKSLPKWNDPVKRAVQQHLVESGYTPEEIGMLYDPRLIRLAHDAALLKKIQSKRNATVRQVQQAAPVVRPQGRANNATTENQQVGRLKVQAQRSGKESDAIAAVDRLLKQSRDRARRR